MIRRPVIFLALIYGVLVTAVFVLVAAWLQDCGRNAVQGHRDGRQRIPGRASRRRGQERAHRPAQNARGEIQANFGVAKLDPSVRRTLKPRMY